MTYIQCRLSLGHGKAAALVERMEKEGIVSPLNHSGEREVLVGGDADLGRLTPRRKSRGAFTVERSADIRIAHH